MKTCGTSENIPTLERERTQFRSLILQNPNYFGNLELSPYKPVKLLQGITTYEELMCVGLNPPSNRLEAALHVKQELDTEVISAVRGHLSMSDST